MSNLAERIKKQQNDAPLNDYPYYYAWGNNPKHPYNEARSPFYRKSCQVLVRGKMNSCLLEFEDGRRLVTSRNAIRRRKP